MLEDWPFTAYVYHAKNTILASGLTSNTRPSPAVAGSNRLPERPMNCTVASAFEWVWPIENVPGNADAVVATANSNAGRRRAKREFMRLLQAQRSANGAAGRRSFLY
jgi:hypothetical protein